MTGSYRHTESFAEFLRRLWRAKLYLLAGALAGAAGGCILLMTLQPHYEARMIIAPALVQDTGDSLMRFESGAEALRRQIGFNQSLPSDFTRFEQILREGTVSNILSRYDGVLVQIAKEKMFRFQSDDDMTAALLPEYLRRHIRIAPLGATDSRVVSYSHPDPAFAVRLLTHLHTIADETLRQKAASETQDRIGWLQKELMQSANPDHREALTGLLLAQERRRMLVEMDQPFAAEIVEPPAATAKSAWPSRSLVMLGSIFAGLVAGFTVFSLRRRA